MEGFRLGVVIVEEAVDSGLEVGDGPEDAALETALGQDGEEALDGVEPRRGGRREVERPARMARKPSPHGRMLVGGVVVEDRMDGLADGNLVAPIDSQRPLCMLRPITVPSSTFIAANRVVVPFRL